MAKHNLFQKIQFLFVAWLHLFANFDCYFRFANGQTKLLKVYNSFGNKADLNLNL